MIKKQDLLQTLKLETYDDLYIINRSCLNVLERLREELQFKVEIIAQLETKTRDLEKRIIEIGSVGHYFEE